jgi:hypothetical protein
MAVSRREMDPVKVAELRRKERERAYRARLARAAEELFEKVKHRGNFLLRETVAGACRYTFADRSGGPVRADHAEALIAHKGVTLIKEDGNCQMFGVP